MQRPSPATEAFGLGAPAALASSAAAAAARHQPLSRGLFSWACVRLLCPAASTTQQPSPATEAFGPGAGAETGSLATASPPARLRASLRWPTSLSSLSPAATPRLSRLAAKAKSSHGAYWAWVALSRRSFCCMARGVKRRLCRPGWRARLCRPGRRARACARCGAAVGGEERPSAAPGYCHRHDMASPRPSHKRTTPGPSRQLRDVHKGETPSGGGRNRNRRAACRSPPI